MHTFSLFILSLTMKDIAHVADADEHVQNGRGLALFSSLKYLSMLHLCLIVLPLTLKSNCEVGAEKGYPDG